MDIQNPRTNGKSNAIQTKSLKETYTYTLRKQKKEKKMYLYIKKKWKGATKSRKKYTNDNKL